MFALTSANRYYLYLGVTDMRKSFDGLCGLVQDELQRNPFSDEVFLFINKKGDKLKLLKWEPGGFVLYYKRLEEGTFSFPIINEQKQCYEMRWTDFIMMVAGIDWQKVERQKRYARGWIHVKFEPSKFGQSQGLWRYLKYETRAGRQL
jgi:transposase